MRLRLAVLLSVMLLSAGCTGSSQGQGLSRASTPTPTGEQPLPAPADAIELQCSAGSGGLKPSEAKLHGVSTGFFSWDVNLWKGQDPKHLVTKSIWGRQVHAEKSVLYVFPDASARTRIELLSPSTARLFYTDWGTWSSDSSAKGRSKMIATTASSVVSVPRCGEEVWGVPGFLLLQGPACVTFRVTGQDPDWGVTRTVPYLKQQC